CSEACQCRSPKTRDDCAGISTQAISKLFKLAEFFKSSHESSNGPRDECYEREGKQVRSDICLCWRWYWVVSIACLEVDVAEAQDRRQDDGGENVVQLPEVLCSVRKLHFSRICYLSDRSNGPNILRRYEIFPYF